MAIDAGLEASAAVQGQQRAATAARIAMEVRRACDEGHDGVVSKVTSLSHAFRAKGPVLGVRS